MTTDKTFLFGLPIHVVEKMRGVFAQYKSLKKVIIYGSRAQGNYRSNSDIDLCIEGESLDLTQLFKIEMQLDDLLLPWKIDLSLKHHIDNPALLEHIKTEGVEFFTF